MMFLGARVASRMVLVAVCLATALVGFPTPSEAAVRPQAPSSCWVTNGSSGPVVHWNGVAGARGYYVFRDGVRARRASAQKRSAVDHRASAGTHGYRVAAYNQAGRGYQRNCGSGSTRQAANNNSVPAKPSFCNVTKKNGKPQLRWASTANVTYIIWRDGKRINASEKASYTDLAARPGLRRYSVAAANAKGAGARRYCGRITI